MTTGESVIPFGHRGIRAIDVANMLGVSPRTVVERLAKRDGFPRPIYNRPKVWIAAEVIAWRDAQRTHAGRARGAP